MAFRNQSEAMLSGILSTAELESLNQRIQILAYLSLGHTQRSIAKRLKVGVATVSRGAAALKQSAALQQYMLSNAELLTSNTNIEE